MKRAQFLLISSLAFFLTLTALQESAAYTIKSQFGNLTDCDTMTRSGFIIWWQNDQDLSADASRLLDTMLAMREACLNEHRMVDPPNIREGYYYNVYIYRNGDLFPDNWGNGQGTDQYGYPFLTLPKGAHKDWGNVAHETFHVFQYSANAPGFEYGGDSQWYIEATANWFAAQWDKSHATSFIEAESLVRLPHVSLWLSYANMPSYYPDNWQRFVHQYAMALLLFYLTEEAGVPGSTIVEGFYSGTNELPQEYLYNRIGATAFRQHFIDWAAHMTNDFDFITPQQKARNEAEWKNVADSTDDNEFVQTYVDAGSDGWYRPADSDITTAWSFNTYRIFNAGTDKYTFRIAGDPAGSRGTLTHFQGQVLVLNENTGASFHNLEMLNRQEGTLTIDVTPADTAIYFIVASMPEHFRDVEQTFGYRVNIIKGPAPTTGVDEETGPTQRMEIARYNLLGQQIDTGYTGMQIVRYSDGTYEKSVGTFER